MMFRWVEPRGSPVFVGLSMDAPVWDVTVFTENGDRLLAGGIARGFLTTVLADPQVKLLLSDEHFLVNRTLIEAGANMKSFRPEDGSGEPPESGRSGEVDFYGKPCGIEPSGSPDNDTHASTIDPDARLYKKAASQAAKLCHMGHALMENRNGLVVNTFLTKATGTAEREAAVAMVEALPDDGRITLGTDKSYDAQDFVAEMRRLGVTPHVTQNNNKKRRSALDGRTTRHASLRVCKRVGRRQQNPEEICAGPPGIEEVLG